MKLKDLYRDMFIYFLVKYVYFNSLSPHISAGMLCRSIVSIVDNYVLLQRDGNIEKLRPGVRYYLASDLGKLSQQIDKAVEIYMRDK